MNRKKKIWAITLLSLVICGAFFLAHQSNETKAANGVIEHKHAWETPSKCSKCGGDHKINITCTTCNGKGYWIQNEKVTKGCQTCGGRGQETSDGRGNLVMGSGVSGTKDCTKCYASGQYKGKNTRCTRSGCSKNSYAAWSDYPNGICYTETAYTKVTFRKNDGSENNVVQTFTYGKSGNKFGYNANGTPKWGTSGQFGAWDRAGYTLLGWAESPTATTATYLPYNSVIDPWIEQKYPNVTLYAVWKPKNVEVTFHRNDGSGNTAKQTFTAGAAHNQFGYNADGSLTWGNSGQFGAWNRTGYKLLGWSEDPNATTANYLPYNSVIDPWIGDNSPSVNLYAVWSNCTHSWEITVTFFGVECTRQCTSCGKEQVCTWFALTEGVGGVDCTPAYEGYQEDTIMGVSWMFDDAGNPTYYGLWHDTGTEVTFSVRVKEGYRFSCIHNGEDIHTNENSYTFTKTGASTWTPVVWKESYWTDIGLYLGRTKSCAICGDATLNAIWVGTDGDDSITVTPNNPNYASATTNDDMTLFIWEYLTGEDVSFTASGDAGYSYYWSKDDVDYPDSDTFAFTVTASEGLSAKKTQNEFTVTYNANGGTFTDGTTENKTAEVIYDKNVPLDLVCQKEGYNFVGWALSKTDAVTLPYLQMPAENITLYAMYSLPVSDVEKALLAVWSTQDTSTVIRYPLVFGGETINARLFSIENLDITQGLTFTSTDNIYWKIEIYDYAGNVRELIPENTPNPPPALQYYIQTVEHYIWIENMKEGGGEWKYLTTTQEKVESGKTFTPEYLSEENEKYPKGYYNYSIDSAYIATNDKTTKAYYKPTVYKLIFDANGGTCETAYKTIYFGHCYGLLPDAKETYREGYDFLGWFSEQEGGTKISENDIHSTLSDYTTYAHWDIHTHKVTYNYWTNGGSSASSGAKNNNFGDGIDLSVTAAKPKEGWEHIGWNIVPEATTAMTTSSTWYCSDCNKTHHISSMPDHEVTLYAIYKKDMTATFVDSSSSDVTKVEVTIYNQTESEEIVIPEQTIIAGWDVNGWSTQTNANAETEIVPGATYELTGDITFYGLHTKIVTLSYDTKDSAQVIESQSGIRYFNASGNYKNPEFVIAEGPLHSNESFVNWAINGGPVENKSGTQLTWCLPGETVLVLNNTTLVAQHDKYPTLLAYDRFYTLEDATEGRITIDSLLESVIATDEEDGTLTKSTGLSIPDYNATEFTSLTSNATISIMYQATDSFGNTVTKTVNVHIVNTVARDTEITKEARFIELKYLLTNDSVKDTDNDGFLDGKGNAANYGGLYKTSLWKTNSVFKTSLFNALEGREEKNAPTNRTYIFTPEDIKSAKEYVKTYGFADFLSDLGRDNFISQFLMN